MVLSECPPPADKAVFLWYSGPYAFWGILMLGVVFPLCVAVYRLIDKHRAKKTAGRQGLLSDYGTAPIEDTVPVAASKERAKYNVLVWVAGLHEWFSWFVAVGVCTMCVEGSQEQNSSVIFIAAIVMITAFFLCASVVRYPCSIFAVFGVLPLPQKWLVSHVVFVYMARDEGVDIEGRDYVIRYREESQTVNVPVGTRTERRTERVFVRYEQVQKAIINGQPHFEKEPVYASREVDVEVPITEPETRTVHVPYRDYLPAHYERIRQTPFLTKVGRVKWADVDSVSDEACAYHPMFFLPSPRLLLIVAVVFCNVTLATGFVFIMTCDNS